MEQMPKLKSNLAQLSDERGMFAHILVKIYRLLNDCKPEELEEALRELFKPHLITTIKEVNREYVQGNQVERIKKGEKVKKYSVDEAFEVDIPTEFD